MQALLFFFSSTLLYLLGRSVLCITSEHFCYFLSYSPTFLFSIGADLPLAGSTLVIAVVESFFSYSDFLSWDLLVLRVTWCDVFIPIICFSWGFILLQHFYRIHYNAGTAKFFLGLSLFFVYSILYLGLLTWLFWSSSLSFINYLNFVFDTQSISDTINDQFQLIGAFTLWNLFFIWCGFALLLLISNITYRFVVYLLLFLLFYLGLGNYMLGVTTFCFVEGSRLFYYFIKEYE